jgi:dienelactone hydrolase
MLQTSKIEYVDGNVLLEGYCALDDSKPGVKPAVLIAHDWSGRNDFFCQKAEQLAELGYVGFALDMYGNGKTGKTLEEKKALHAPFMADRNLIRSRMLAAFDTVQKLDAVNTARIGAIGFCFGGTCVLDLARTGAELKGGVSFHGGLAPPEGVATKKIRAKILALHGYDDPMVSHEQVAAFEAEMNNGGVDWQLNVYGHAKHGFTNPQAHDEKLGIVYNNLADRRSWANMREFFTEIFAAN